MLSFFVLDMSLSRNRRPLSGDMFRISFTFYPSAAIRQSQFFEHMGFNGHLRQNGPQYIPNLTLPYRGAPMLISLSTLSIRLLAALALAGLGSAFIGSANAEDAAKIDPMQTSATPVAAPK